MEIVTKSYTDFIWCLDIGPGILFDPERFNNFYLGAQEAEGKEDQLCREELLRSWNFFHLPPPTAVLGPLDAHWKIFRDEVNQ